MLVAPPGDRLSASPRAVRRPAPPWVRWIPFPKQMMDHVRKRLWGHKGSRAAENTHLPATPWTQMQIALQ